MNIKTTNAAIFSDSFLKKAYNTESFIILLVLSEPMFPSQKPYIILKNVISPEICDLLAEYTLFKARTEPTQKKANGPLPNVFRQYGDSMMELLLQRLTPIIEQTVEKTLWPTLSFYYTYTTGHQLIPHKDRSSCQIVAGLCIGMDKLFQEQHKSWPLIIQSEKIYLNPGDIVIFSGYETEHWREPFQGEWFVSAIFGYVDKHGPFAFQKYDQRKSLGKPHVGMFRWGYGCLKNALKQLTRHDG